MKCISVLSHIASILSCTSLAGIVITNPPDSGHETPGKNYPSYRALNIPNGHLPPPGSCRLWHPGKTLRSTTSAIIVRNGPLKTLNRAPG